MDVLGVLRFLVLDSGNYITLRSSEERQLRLRVFQSKRIIKQMHLYGESICLNLKLAADSRPNRRLPDNPTQRG